MTKTIELSKRLLELAEIQENEARYFQNHVNQFEVYKNEYSSYTGSKEESWWKLKVQKHKQWAEDLRSLIIPPPGERYE
jgi:ribosomal protein L16 Arg81 hydroxylase